MIIAVYDNTIFYEPPAGRTTVVGIRIFSGPNPTKCVGYVLYTGVLKDDGRHDSFIYRGVPEYKGEALDKSVILIRERLGYSIVIPNVN